ncbi:MAG: DnaJ domain-containing protein [Crocinitomicaceae bacterium]|nr:DnaJ domain-containing protein [Crocinitomicaceae bacterium]
MKTLSHYYSVLGLSESATQAEIKKRYRHLAMKYHPDKMGGDQQKFQEILEAYEYLSGQKKLDKSTIHTTTRSRSNSSARNQPVEERIKRAKQQYKENLYKEYVDKEHYFSKLTSGLKWKIIKIASVIGVFITFVLLLELLLPYRFENDRINGANYITMSGLTSVNEVRQYYLESGKSIYFDDIPRYLYSTPELIICKSFIFHNNRKVKFIFSKDKEEYATQYDLGSHTYLLIPFFLAPFGVYLFQRRTYSYVFFFYLSLYCSTAISIIYLLSNNRILHLFTLGWF